MKINATALAAALGLASAVVASAQSQVGVSYIYLTGSSAARSAVYNTLSGTAVFDAAPVVVSYGDALPQNGSFMEFSNTIATVPTIIKAHWSGSEAGIIDVSGATLELFLSDLGNSGVPSVTTTAATVPTGTTNDVHTVDIAQADNDVAFSRTPGTTATEISDSLIIPFVFVKNATTITGEAGLTNINNANFANLAAGGDKLALFTGVEQAAGTTNYVYLTGRDNNSGTRVNVFGITGWGITHNPKQVKLTGGTPNAFSGAYTSSGQSSGGTLAKSLTDSTTSADTLHSTTSSGGWIAVTYLGLADDATAEGAPFNARRLQYNGTTYSTAAVESGSYTLWGNEYTLFKSGSVTNVTALASNLVTSLPSNTSGFEIPFSSAFVSRTGPNSPVTHN